jgi:asparagine synthase (glutamine-hydrolysing)
VCGIAGKVSAEGPVNAELLEGMCESILHRGPDSRGLFLDQGVGLGIQRLAVIDLQTGDQPIFNEDESVVIVLNGEIYNYVELRDELERAGHTFRTHTDTEVIVHLYEQHGERCVEHLRGMFAFALWDRRERRLLLARDRVGKKPLFYAVRGGTLWFSSEPGSILRDDEVPRDVDLGAVDGFLRLGYVPSPGSAFAALRKLPPAHTLTWDGKTARTKRYWRLSYRTRHEGLSYPEQRELVRESLLEATRLRLRSDVPLGAFLSGGVDSTAVVAAMAQEASGTIRTFSIGFDVASHDETRYAAEVSKLFGTEHEEFRVEPHAVDVLPQLVWHYGEPFADDSAVPTWYLSELTRRHVTVALNGDGGDESFAGYDRYFFHDVVRRFGWVPGPLSGAAARLLGRTVDASSPRPVRQMRWLAEGLGAALPERYAGTMAHLTPELCDELYTPSFKASLDRSDTPAPAELVGEILADSDGESQVERLLDVDVQTYLAGDLLPKVDIASMAHSLEVRSPLLDHVLMETAAGLPSSAKLHGRVQKKVLKDVVRMWVPDRILDRPKMGFTPPLGAWLRGELSELPEQLLLDPRARERDLFEEGAVRRLIDDHRSGRADRARVIWTLIWLELWFQTYIDPAKPAPVGALVA